MRRLSAITVPMVSLLLLACSSRADRSNELAAIRLMYVTPTISGHLSDTGHRMEAGLQAAVARALAARGYAVGSEAGADGIVRVAWIPGQAISPSGQEERTLSLSLSIFSRAGDRLYSGRSVQSWPERVWSEDRVSSEIARLLNALPDAKAGLTPAEGKPALAPIRLK